MTREENALKLRHKHYNFKDSNNGSTKVIFIIGTISILFILLTLFN